MNGKSINFEHKKINQSVFYKNKKLFNMHDIDVNKILVSKEKSSGTKNSLKYFIGYNDDDVIRPLCINLPQMIGYVKNFDKCLSLIVLDSVIRVSKKYYPSTLLEECKYVIRKNKMENLINDDLDLSSSDNETDNESDNESDSDKSND